MPPYKPSEALWEGLEPGVYRDSLTGYLYRLERLVDNPDKKKRPIWKAVRLEHEVDLSFYPYLRPVEEEVSVEIHSDTKPQRKRRPKGPDQPSLDA